MEWIGLMNNIQVCAKEIVNNEIKAAGIISAAFYFKKFLTTTSNLDIIYIEVRYIEVE